jgi:hypothetical protein
MLFVLVCFFKGLKNFTENFRIVIHLGLKMSVLNTVLLGGQCPLSDTRMARTVYKVLKRNY